MSAVPEIPQGIIALLEIGAKFKYKEMENGEQRYAVTLPTSEWVRTVTGPVGGWQNAHYHRGLYEHYVVEAGWMAVAHFHDDAEDETRMRVWMLQTNQAHNLYLPAGAVINTFKIGTPVGNPDRKGNDWWPHDMLDSESKALSEKELWDVQPSFLTVIHNQ